jgi:hypothetical protein
MLALAKIMMLDASTQLFIHKSRSYTTGEIRVGLEYKICKLKIVAIIPQRISPIIRNCGSKLVVSKKVRPQNTAIIKDRKVKVSTNDNTTAATRMKNIVSLLFIAREN